MNLSVIRVSRLGGAMTVAALGLAACGATPGVTSSAGSGAYPAQVAAPAPTPMPTPLPALVSTAPPITGAPPIQVPLPAVGLLRASAPPALLTMRTFAIFPFGNAGARGTVTVRLQASGFAVSVAAQNLVPGTAHSIHLHAGSCGAAVAGTHLVILGTIAANGMGSGGIATRVGLHYSTGRFVIVYANLSPATIIGCADLGTI